MTVTEAVYQAVGKPAVDKPVIFEDPGFCGNCHTTAPAAPAHKILTGQFGSWDHIIADAHGRRWLCAPCAWAFRAADYRRQNTLITTSGALSHPTAPELQDILQRPISADTAIIVPTSMKKIVLPRARWGTLAHDAGTITWTPRHRRILNAAKRLRALGCTEADLQSPSVPFRILIDADPMTRTEVPELWRTMAPARTDRTYMPLVLTLTRKAKKS